MRSLTKILAFTLLLSLGSIFLVNDGVSAQENYRNTNEAEPHRPNSIQAATTIEIPYGASFPPRIWYTKGDYRGYLYIESYEVTRNNTYIGLYRGTLYLHVAPVKVDPDEEEK